MSLKVRVCLKSNNGDVGKIEFTVGKICGCFVGNQSKSDDTWCSDGRILVAWSGNIEFINSCEFNSCEFNSWEFNSCEFNSFKFNSCEFNSWVLNSWVLSSWLFNSCEFIPRKFNSSDSSLLSTLEILILNFGLDPLFPWKIIKFETIFHLIPIVQKKYFN